MCVCVCVCERERECACVCVSCVHVSINKQLWQVLICQELECVVSCKFTNRIELLKLILLMSQDLGQRLWAEK